jgi:hypothetical protein
MKRDKEVQSVLEFIDNVFDLSEEYATLAEYYEEQELIEDFFDDIEEVLEKDKDEDENHFVDSE